MSKSGDNLRGLIHSLQADLGDVQKGREVKARVAPSIPRPEAGLSPWALVIGIGGGALASLGGIALSLPALAAVGAVASLAGAVLAAFWIGGRGLAAVREEAASDVAVEVIKRKSLELEKTRLSDELRLAHRAVSDLEAKYLKLQEAMIQERANTVDQLGRLERELREGAEKERLNLLDNEERKLEGLRQEVAREREYLQRDLAQRDEKIGALNAEAARLRETLERQAAATLSERTEALGKSAEEERKALMARLQQQQDAFQRRLADLETEYARKTASLEEKLRDLAGRNARLQEGMEQEAIANSTDMSAHIAEMRKGYEERQREQEAQFQRRLAEKDRELVARREEADRAKVDLLLACEAYLKEVEALEAAVARREEELKKRGG